MKTLSKIAGLIFGLAFFVFGLNGFLQFLPSPQITGAAGAFMGGLGQSVYFFPLLKATETLCGLLILTGYLVPLALVVITPVMLNILLFHAFLAPAGLPLPIVLLILHIILTIANWSHYKAFFTLKNSWLS